MVSKYRMPLIKKRVINPIYYSVYKPTLDLISKNGYYDITQIWANVNRIEREEMNVHGINTLKLKEFCDSHRRIFIYGKGNVGTQIARYMENEKMPLYAYIVTKKEHEDESMELDTINFEMDDGVIIGVAYDSDIYYEILSLIKNKMNDDNIFLPNG